jgi:50S ribosomal protein L16 3-hydroxylase
MKIQTPLALLGGLSPEQFMQTYWQKKPLIVRAAVPGMQPLLPREALFALAANEAVESRLIERTAEKWRFSHGPVLKPPPLKRKEWTLLVQGMDMHDADVHAFLQQFRFVPDARLDDLMISYASLGGGVGPHFDSYDVFLLQAAGRRRWRIGPQKDLSLRDDVPLKLLANFKPTQEFDLEPGDMLYLPPRYAHDGVALEHDCQTYSIGFRAPSVEELARELLHRVAEEFESSTLYADRTQAATANPGAIPAALQEFAAKAVASALQDGALMQLILGEYLTEPKVTAVFDAGKAPKVLSAVRLDRRSRMMYDAKHVYLNGASWKVAGKDAKWLRKLADTRGLDAPDLRAISPELTAALVGFIEQGWAHVA